MPYKQYSDNYLLKMNKKEIIDLLRVAEHNFFATEEGLQNSARFGAEVLAENAELKRLLKLAVEDFTAIAEVHAAATPILCPQYGKYMKAIDIRTRKWQYADEALKLIEG